MEGLQTGWRLRLKRAIDLGSSAALLVATSPVMGITALVIRLQMGAPVLFRQERPGRHAVPFTLYKFRTMAPGAGSDADRLTGLGRFLRATSLDELPQLFNVFSGEMSLVGPRPLLMEYLARYSQRQARRHEVLPGITGWAQVNGRNALSHEQRFELDVWYVENWSLRLDLQILAATAVQILRRSGINAAGHATMPIFGGGEPAAERPADFDGTQAR